MADFKPKILQAQEISRGHAVRRPDDKDPKKNFMKAERQGTDYVHHYLIPIGLVCKINMSLIYVDPEENLIDWGCIPDFNLISSETYKKPEVGHIFENSNGTFLKVIEAPKSQKMFAFININSGEVKRRQERNIIRIFDFWETNCIS